MGQFADSISKITFCYDKGHYTFGTSGYYAISEIIEYSKSNSTNFHITRHFQLKKYYNSKTNTVSTDTIRLKSPKAHIPFSKTEKLMTELNISRDNFNAAYVRPFLKAPAKSEITSIAKKHDLIWKFENEYSDREDRRELVKNINRFSLLDTFLLKKKPNLEYDLVIHDAWNSLSITCIGTTDTIEYRSQFFELLGQPVSKYVNRKYGDGKKFINLEINNSIQGIVPANSLISQAVDLNQLKEEYIMWYIKEKM